MREPTKDNDAGRLLMGIIAGDGMTPLRGLLPVLLPAPAMDGLTPGAYVERLRAWHRRMWTDAAYWRRLLMDLDAQGYVTMVALPTATDKGRALVDGWK